MVEKLTSRKFLTALAGLITGILLILSGETTEGTASVICAVISYCASEGYVDAKRLMLEMEKQTDKEEE